MTNTQSLLDANLENINGPVPEPSSLNEVRFFVFISFSWKWRIVLNFL